MIINPRKKVEAGAGARAPGGAPPIAPVQTPSGGGGTGHPGRTGSGDAGAGAPRLERKGTVAVASGKEFMKQLQEAVATPGGGGGGAGGGGGRPPLEYVARPPRPVRSRSRSRSWSRSRSGSRSRSRTWSRSRSGSRSRSRSRSRSWQAGRRGWEGACGVAGGRLRSGHEHWRPLRLPLHLPLAGCRDSVSVFGQGSRF
jgi:hypothetical protein